MGQRGEVFSTRVMKDDVTYFFNVKENIYGEMFLNIAQSTKDGGRFARQAIVVYQEKLDDFLQGIEKQIDFVKTHAPKGRPLDFKPMHFGGKKKAPAEDEPVVIGRVYEFKTNEDDWGDLSVTITERKNSADMTYNLRQSIKVYQEDLGEFARKLQEAVDYIHIHSQKSTTPSKAVKVQRHFVVRRKTSSTGEEQQNPAASSGEGQSLEE